MPRHCERDEGACYRIGYTQLENCSDRLIEQDLAFSPRKYGFESRSEFQLSVIKLSEAEKRGVRFGSERKQERYLPDSPIFCGGVVYMG